MVAQARNAVRGLTRKPIGLRVVALALIILALPALAVAAAGPSKSSAPFKGGTEVGGRVTVHTARANGIRVVESVSFRRFSASCARGDQKFKFKISGRAAVIDSERRFKLSAGSNSSSDTVRGHFTRRFRKVKGNFRFTGSADGGSCATGKRSWHAKR